MFSFERLVYMCVFVFVCNICTLSMYFMSSSCHGVTLENVYVSRTLFLISGYGYNFGFTVTDTGFDVVNLRTQQTDNDG